MINIILFISKIFRVYDVLPRFKIIRFMSENCFIGKVKFTMYLFGVDKENFIVF